MSGDFLEKIVNGLHCDILCDDDLRGRQEKERGRFILWTENTHNASQAASQQAMEAATHVVPICRKIVLSDSALLLLRLNAAHAQRPKKRV